jgi:organic hydroperoxide reductase OsmC/OhrA
LPVPRLKPDLDAQRDDLMSLYTTDLLWQRGDQPFTDRRYSRAHRIRFDGGLEISGSSSPQVVPVPLSDPAAADPEELFVAALSSCHMLWFLDIACRAGWTVDGYDDAAEGKMAKDAEGRLAMTRVVLRPAVAFAGDRRPDAAEVARLHHEAHERCFIANSVRSEVTVEPR